ncbi:MAG: HAD family hydrolase, partial [Limnobacter sp.]|nr:HAD family hydrolase [Limnobacter sp.]
MKLALFDLDNTLLPLDSDHAWLQFLVDQGIESQDFAAKNDAFYAQYQAGKLDIHEFLAFQLKPLASHKRAQLDIWHAQFMHSIIQPAITNAALDLIAHHKAEQAECLVITATNSFVTRPIVKALGLEHLIATEPEVMEGEFTGKVLGTPSFQGGKVTRLLEWLHARGGNLESFESVCFYSDSLNDLPLLE